MALLEIENLSAFYGKAQALHDISFSVEESSTIALIGANGAGKSTLLDSIMGLTERKGEIRFESNSIIKSKSSHIVKVGIGYAPERFNLFPYMSVRDNLLVGAYTARDSVEKNLAMIHQLFPRLEEREHQETSTQSGGERQMVSLGRALMSNPRLLLVDEPTIGLAPKVCLEIAGVLKKLRQKFNLTVVITEQNANFAMTLADKVYVLENGRISAQGTPDELAGDKRLSEAYLGHYTKPLGF